MIGKGGTVMNAKRKIRARDVIDDIRTGMNVSDLMAKYQLTLRGLRTAFQKLLEADAVTSDELNNLKSLHDISVSGLRRFRRKRLNPPLKIFDGGDPFKSGVVKDISEKGVCIQGIQTEVGDLKNFIGAYFVKTIDRIWEQSHGAEVQELPSSPQAPEPLPLPEPNWNVNLIMLRKLKTVLERRTA
jgi:hypothetical protein